MSILKNLTIIIITNRHNYLKRLLDFYEPYNINIIVADGHPEVFAFKDSYKINYIHYPNLHPSKKNILALNESKTKYTMLSADDDFTMINATKECIKFLDENEDYVCAQGKVNWFVYFSKTHIVKFSENIKVNDNKLTSQEKAIDRIKSFKENYRYTVCAIHRTKSLQKVFSELAKANIYNPNYIELMQAALTLIIGKTKELDIIYNIRESVVSSLGAQSKRVSELVYEKDEDIQKSKKLIYNFSKEHKNSEEDSKKMFNDIITNFLIYEENDFKKNLENDTKYIKASEYKELQNIENIVKKHDIYSGAEYEPDDIAKYNLSKNINALLHMLETFFRKHKNQKFIIYGAGTIAKLIDAFYPENILYFVDKNIYNKNLYFQNKDIKHPDFLQNNIEYNIFITVLGREEAIKHYLQNELNIKAKIFCL